MSFETRRRIEVTEDFLSKISQVYVRNRRTWICVLILFAAIFYSAGVGSNPPGFYIDESSVAYNAHLIAQTGADEHGVIFPLYFRSFGEYKNPAFIYLLAALDPIFGPSILLARGLSAALGFAAALLLGLLAVRLSGRDIIGILITAFALFGPWLFEVSRLAYEVAIFPLAIVLFLFALHKASTRDRWSAADSLWLGLALAFITYSYSIGRLLAPLLALGFILFATRRNFVGIFRTWIIYGLTLLPLFFFFQCNPKALITRFYTISYIRPDSSLVGIAPEWASHYLNVWNPRLMFLVGDQSTRQHIPGTGSVLFGVFVLALIAVVIILCERPRRPYWLYIVYGTLVSVIPASLTNEPFHSLRLVALPVFLLLLTVPALTRLFRTPAQETGLKIGRKILISLIVLAIAQTVWFQYIFHKNGIERSYEFEVAYTKVLDAALSTGNEPIYLWDTDYYPSYIHAYWYGTLRGIDLSRFRRLKLSTLPPPGAVVLGTVLPCETCPVILSRDNFTAYRFEEKDDPGP